MKDSSCTFTRPIHFSSFSDVGKFAEYIRFSFIYDSCKILDYDAHQGMYLLRLPIHSSRVRSSLRWVDVSECTVLSKSKKSN